MPVLLFIGGLFLVVRGGDLFVDAARWMAEISGIPKFVIGATVVSLATTMPELLVSLFSALEGSIDLAVGNAVGTVTVNTGLIMGISILWLPAKLDRATFSMKAVLMLISAVVLAAFGSMGTLGIAPCMLLITLFMAFIAESIHSGKLGREKEGRPPKSSRKTIFVNLLKFLAGAMGIVVGADLMVDEGLILASAFGVPEAVAGVTLMGIGTSLPELVTTIVALRRGEASMSIGNIVGANVIDLTLILPLCTLASGKALPISQQARNLDLPVLALVLCVAVLPAIFGKRMRRIQGAVLILLYAAYMVILFASGGRYT